MQRRYTARISVLWLTSLFLLLSAGAVWADDATAAPAPPTPDAGATAWMLTSTGLVLLMVPGLGMFYGGLVRTKNVLGTMMHSFTAMGIIGVLWVVCGYALAFGTSVCGGWFGWKSEYFFMKGIDESVVAPMGTNVPEYVFAMFQGKFAIITPALIAGAFAERVRFRGYCIFIALWSLVVYCPIAHWVWAADGFLFKMGAMGAIDFAGGTVVHISSGVSALVAILYLGGRKGHPGVAPQPNNMTMVLMGAGLLWVGWFGFNAGSAVASNQAAAQALAATQTAAAAAAVWWILIEAFHHGKGTALGFASGILAGLVAITPAAGVLQPWAAIVLGCVASTICYGAIMLKGKLGYDDTLDVFGVHGVGGITGALGLSFFIRPSWMATAQAKVAGWSMMDQLVVQAKAVGCSIGYAALGTIILVIVVDKLFGLRLKPEDELSGIDETCHGERGYILAPST